MPHNNAFAYLRVSGLGQNDGDGFDRQRAAITAYAQSHNLTVANWYQDTQTGKDEWQERPGWSAMMADLNGCRTILVESLNRVARALLVQELIVADLAKREVRLLTSTGEDTEDDSPERVMFRQLLGIFAQYERASIVLKLRGARQRKKEETGRCEGRKPFGERTGESETLALMRGLRAGGLAYDAIAAQLNQNGHATRGTKAGRGVWIGATVAKILGRTAQ